MPKITKKLIARMEELGMEFVLKPPPPLPVAPRFEKDIEVIIEPLLDTEPYREQGIRTRGRLPVYVRDDAWFMGREAAERLAETQKLCHIRLFRMPNPSNRFLRKGTPASD